MTLDDLERVRLAIQHKKERAEQIRDQIKMVLFHDKGWSPRKITGTLLISCEAVRAHIQDYDIAKKLRSLSTGSRENYQIYNLNSSGNR